MTRIQAYILLSCGLTLGACSSSDDKDEELTPSESVAGQTVDFSTETDDEEIGVLDQGDIVGMTVINELTGEAETVNAQFVVDANGLLVGVNNITFPENGAPISIFAYSPYREDWNDATDGYRSIDLPTNQLLYEQYHNADLIVGLPEGGNPVTQTSVKIVFSHAFAQVNLEVTDPNAATNLSAADVQLGPVSTSAFVNQRTGEVTSLASQTDYVTPYPTLSSHQTRSDRRETYSAIVVPQQKGQGDPFLIVTTATRTFKFTLPEAVEWQSGMTYDYQVEISANGITLVSSSISKWTEGTGGNLELEEDE